jgi:hypothetical protein
MAMKWDRDGMELRIMDTVYNDYSNPGYILNEAFMDPIQHWCWETMPTVRRTAFNTFRFCQEQDITVFLLKWG